MKEDKLKGQEIRYLEKEFEISINGKLLKPPQNLLEGEASKIFCNFLKILESLHL